jgi:hypothetical protein
MTEYKQCRYSLHKAIKQAKRQYRDKVVSQFNGMWQCLQSNTDYKKKTSPATDQDVLLPDKLNFFAHFEDNTVPLTLPSTKTCGLSFTAANVSKTFKCVNPRKAAGPDGIPSRILRTCADQLASVFTDIFNQSLSQSAVPKCFKRATIVPLPKKAKVTELNAYLPVALTSVNLMSQEGQKDHQGQQPPELLPVHPAIIQKARSVQVHQSWDRETEKHLLSQGQQTVKQPPLTLSGCFQHIDSNLKPL